MALATTRRRPIGPRPGLRCSARLRLAAGHAESRRRLGGLRSRHQPRSAHQVPFADHNAMLDPSCPDITARVLECLGHYRLRHRTSAGSTGPSAFIEPHAGRRRLLAGPLGRELHLRDLAGAARAGRRRLRHAASPWSSGPSPGSRKCSRPAAAGAKPAAATTIRPSRARERRPLRRPPGP